MLIRHDHLTTRDDRDSALRSSCPSAPSLSTKDSAELLGGARRIAIQHRGETYFLTETRANKLILTK